MRNWNKKQMICGIVMVGMCIAFASCKNQEEEIIDYGPYETLVQALENHQYELAHQEFIGIVQPAEDVKKEENTTEYQEVILGEWMTRVNYYYQDLQTELIFKEDGTCMLYGNLHTWNIEKVSENVFRINVYLDKEKKYQYMCKFNTEHELYYLQDADDENAPKYYRSNQVAVAVINMDNMWEYFEMKKYLDKGEQAWYEYCVGLCMKPEYGEKFLMEGQNMHVDWYVEKVPRACSIDKEKMEITLGGIIYHFYGSEGEEFALFHEEDFERNKTRGIYTALVESYRISTHSVYGYDVSAIEKMEILDIRGEFIYKID